MIRGDKSDKGDKGDQVIRVIRVIGDKVIRRYADRGISG